MVAKDVARLWEELRHRDPEEKLGWITQLAQNPSWISPLGQARASLRLDHSTFKSTGTAEASKNSCRPPRAQTGQPWPLVVACVFLAFASRVCCITWKSI